MLRNSVQFCAVSLGLVLVEHVCQNFYVACFLSIVLVLLAAEQLWLDETNDTTFEAPHLAVPYQVQSVNVEEELVAEASDDLDKHSFEFDKVVSLQQSDKPFQAIEELDRLKQSGRFNPEELSKVQKQHWHKIQLCRNEIYRLVDLLENQDNWKYRMRHNKSDVYASLVDSRDFKVVCNAPKSNIFDLISMIYETDLYHKWLPGCTESKRVKRTLFHQHLTLRFGLPFPLKDRNVLLKGYGDVWRGSKVMIYVGSIDSAQAEQDLGIKPGACRVDVVFSGILLRPLETGGTEMTIISRLDLKMSLLPDSIFDYAAKFILADLLGFLRDRTASIAAHPHKPENKWWADRQKGEDSHVYEEIRRRLSTLQASSN